MRSLLQPVIVGTMLLGLVGVGRGAGEPNVRLSKEMNEARNGQINAELYSSYLYLSMAAYFEARDLKGFAHWMRMQAQEESKHGHMFFDYVNDRDGRVLLTAIKAPPTEWKGPMDAFQEVYAHEQKITDMINQLVRLSEKVSDPAMHNFLQWFVKEQIEEMATAKQILAQLKLIKGNPTGLYLIDRDLGKRSKQVAAPAK